MFYLQKNVEMIQNLFTGNIHLFVNVGRSNESSSQVSGGLQERGQQKHPDFISVQLYPDPQTGFYTELLKILFFLPVVWLNNLTCNGWGTWTPLK